MTFINKHYRVVLFLLVIVSFFLHYHVFNLDLVGIHVWRQTETQTVINNFYRDDFNIFFPRINAYADTDRLHRMEFPLMQWIFALFYKLFGPYIAVTRVLSFLTGLGSVFGMFYFCNNIFKNKAIATLCAWAFNFSPVFYYYTLNPMPDNMALCYGIWSLALFYSYINTRKIKYVVASSIFLGLAALIKLPFILYGAFILSFIFVHLKQKEYSVSQLIRIAAIYVLFIIPALAWYAFVIPTWQNGVITGILSSKQYMGELLYILTGNITSVLPELLINYGSVLFFAAGFYFIFKNKANHNKYFPLFFFTGIVIILYFLFELNMITTVHDYYLFPFLPFIFLIVAYGVAQLLSSRNRFVKGLSIFCLLILPVTAFLRADSRWGTQDPGFNVTYFKYKNDLRNLTPQHAYCIVGNDVSSYILLYYIDRKGWAFQNDDLDEKRLSFYISKGAQYLFIDDNIDNNPGIKSHLAKKVFDKETVRVYKLK